MFKLDLILQWTAVFLTVLGSVFTALNMYPENVYAFNVGSILWLWWALRIKSKSLIAVNALMLVIYAVGTLKVVI